MKCCSLEILLTSVILYIFRSSCLDVFCKKGAFKNLIACCLVQASACNFINKVTLVQVFSGEFCEIFKNTFFVERFLWLLPHVYKKVNFCNLDQGMMFIIFQNLNILLQINNIVSLKQVNTLVAPTKNHYYTLLMIFVYKLSRVLKFYLQTQF